MNPDRFLVICKADEGAAAWVVAESPDEVWAKEDVKTWRDHVVLGVQEALLDPDYREAVLAWGRGDDTAFANILALEVAEGAVSTAQDVLRAAEPVQPGGPEILPTSGGFDLAEIGRDKSDADRAILQAHGRVADIIIATFNELEQEYGRDAAERFAALEAVEFKGLAEARGTRRVL